MPLKLGILSTAWINERAIFQVTPGIEGLKVLAVASRTEATAAAYSRRYAIPKFYDSYDRLLEDSELDAVYISLPNSLHVEWTSRALSRGKHVLCEKPFSAEPERVLALEGMAATRGLSLMEAMHYRYHPAVRQAVDAVHEGVIGSLEKVSVVFEGDIHRENDIRFQPELDGGALMDAGCYCLDLIRWVTGDDEPAVLATNSEWLNSGVDLTTTGTLLCSGNVSATFSCTLNAKTFNCYATITGTLGSLEMKYPFLPVSGTPEAPQVLFACLKDKTPIVENVSLESSYFYQLEFFKNSIESGTGKTLKKVDRPYYNAALLAKVRELRESKS